MFVAQHPAVPQVLSSLRRTYSDKQSQPRRRASTKSRGITFLEDGERYAYTTAVSRGILIPDKDFLLLERSWKTYTQRYKHITEVLHIYTV